ncbi:hypothetical protein [Streptomyces sp. H39-S7]|uniref:hypothetical protein n=1 Tax=Streptomyces sp. H39-S7 TaxID=3004357 RepID=UPI0022AF504B|nr:hypothetical protein [Streptomyces sp. H39-S7]MCZ4122325.1 hypothetical protein [Streptomyces sp. H39-S7]
MNFTGWPVSAVPGSGICVHTCQFDWTMMTREPVASAGVIDVDGSRALIAVFSDLPTEFGMTFPAFEGAFLVLEGRVSRTGRLDVRGVADS